MGFIYFAVLALEVERWESSLSKKHRIFWHKEKLRKLHTEVAILNVILYRKCVANFFELYAKVFFRAS